MTKLDIDDFFGYRKMNADGEARWEAERAAEDAAARAAGQDPDELNDWHKATFNRIEYVHSAPFDSNVLVANTGHVAIGMINPRVLANEIAFELSVWTHPDLDGQVPSELSDRSDRLQRNLKVAVVFPDGHTEFAKHYFPDEKESKKLKHGVFVSGGSGGGSSFTQTLMIRPISTQPSGKFRIVFEWEAQGIEQTHVCIPTAVVKALQKQVRPIWPDGQKREVDRPQRTLLAVSDKPQMVVKSGSQIDKNRIAFPIPKPKRKKIYGNPHWVPRMRGCVAGAQVMGQNASAALLIHNISAAPDVHGFTIRQKVRNHQLLREGAREHYEAIGEHSILGMPFLPMRLERPRRYAGKLWVACVLPDGTLLPLVDRTMEEHEYEFSYGENSGGNDAQYDNGFSLQPFPESGTLKVLAVWADYGFIEPVSAEFDCAYLHQRAAATINTLPEMTGRLVERTMA